MNIKPTKAYLLIRMHNLPRKNSKIVLPKDSSVECPYGEVIDAGPDCKLREVGDLVIFSPENYVAGFNEHTDPTFIIHEDVVFALYIPDSEVKLSA